MQDFIPPSAIETTTTYTKVAKPVADPAAGAYEAAKTKLTTAVDQHVHSYDSISGEKVIGIDQVILYRVCACEATVAFECGTREAMRELYLKLHTTKGSK